MMRTANPTSNAGTFEDFSVSTERTDAMTIQGTVNKTGLLLVFLMIPAVFVWRKFYQSGDPSSIMPWMMGGLAGGLIFALITVFRKSIASWTAPIYAGCQGLLLGGLSATLEAQLPGIVIQAVALTFGTLFSLLLAYTSRMIKVTENFKLGVAAATGGIFLIYLVSFVMSFFGSTIPYIHESGTIGICFSLFVVVIAALNLVLDFDFIESGVAKGAPKYMEWYAAFGLLVTLVWLYIEILRLLAKLRQR